MAVRTLGQIMKELAPTFDPQISNVRRKQAELPQAQKTELKELEGIKKNAFGDIMQGARRRGLGFSGIPLGEQAEYTSDFYLPEVARTRSRFRDQALSLEDAILGIQERQGTLAREIRQRELDRAESARQARAAAAQQQSYLNSLFAGSQSAPASQGTVTSDTGRNKKQIEEADAAILGKWNALKPDLRKKVFDNLRTSSDPRSQRRYQLAIQLGYIKPAGVGSRVNSILDAARSVSETSRNTTFPSTVRSNGTVKKPTAIGFQL